MQSIQSGFFSTFLLLIRIHRNPYSVQTITYKEMKVNFRGHDEIAIKEVLVDAEYSFLGKSIKSNDKPLVLDVGANIGTFAIWVLSQQKNAIVTSIEANPNTYKILEKNIQSTSEGTTWNAMWAAAGREGETVYISNSGSPLSHRVLSKGEISVSTISLGEIINKICSEAKTEMIDLMKIDIEGSEEDFICAEPMALKRVKEMVIELHPDSCDTEKVKLDLNEIYSDIKEIEGRLSSKPLLYCKN